MLIQAESPDLNLAGDTARPMRIIIVDDSEIDRQRLLRLCEDSGLSFVATEVATLDQLRTALAAQTADLVFIDYLLAGEDGLEAVDILSQSAPPQTASIMIAGEGRIDIAVEAMRRGCADYLTKAALNVDSLRKSVATALERRMIRLTLEHERELRTNLERAIRQYAASSSAEMRTLLAATLRRVRKMRSHMKDPESNKDFGDLENQIDLLWKTLPAIHEGAEGILANARQTALAKPH